jgi:hypothetical protein
MIYRGVARQNIISMVNQIERIKQLVHLNCNVVFPAFEEDTPKCLGTESNEKGAFGLALIVSVILLSRIISCQ